MPLISNPFAVLAFLVLIVLAVLWFTRRFEKNSVIKHLPAPLWCYFLPMIASSAGLIPQNLEIYPVMSKNLLPACLILLLAGAHLRGILKLGPAALISMFAGMLAIILGGPLLYLIYKPWLPADSWMGLGALSASWTGGSANMIAVKEAIGVPENIFSVMVIVDSIVCYLWMAIVLQISSFQKEFDTWNNSRMEWLEQVESPLARGAHREAGGCVGHETSSDKKHTPHCVSAPLFRGDLFVCLALGVLVALIPISSMYAILIATAVGIVVSFLKKGTDPMLDRVGYFLLYLLLTSIGARANLAGIFQTPVYLLFGLSWVLVMAIVLFTVGRIFRIPLFFLASASQANVGGTASATIVSAVYQPHLAFVGLLLAILGNVLGTYLGIACSYMMRTL